MAPDADMTPIDQDGDDDLEDAYDPVEDDGALDDEPLVPSVLDPDDDDEDDPDDDETRILSNDEIPLD